MTIIVLHHGLMGFNRLQFGPLGIRYWDGIADTIARAGYGVLLTQVHPTAGVERRAEQLRRQLLEGCRRIGRPSARFLILAHSLGGLDARYMISRLGMGHRVSALVTISSPHRGSAYYDYLLARLGPLGRIEGLRDAVVDLRALWQVSMAHSIAFNQQVPDMPSVRYCSVTAACGRDRVPLFLRPAYEWIREIQGENDGLVAASSSRWGLELAHWPVHHLHQINHPLRPLSPPSREDIRPRYLQLLSLLNAEGILEPPAGEARPVAPEPAGIF